MSNGGSKTQRVDIVDSYDPQTVGRAALKGTLFRYIPSAGQPKLLIKADDGFSTNWLPTSSADQAFVYYVTPGSGDLPTIQSAINKAYLDGSGTGGVVATIFIPPGVYTENLVFRPGQCLIGQTSQVSVGAIKIIGQHAYTPPVNTDPLEVLVNLQGLSFLDSSVGDTISVFGTEGFFMSISGCAFSKNSASGSAMNAINPTGIFVAVGASSTTFLSPDPFIQATCAVVVVQGCSHSSGSVAPMLNYTGSGSLNFSRNECLGSAPYIMSMSGGTCFANFNFLGAFAPNNDGLRIGAGALMYLTNSTIISSTGTGYVLQGSGTVNGAMIVYGDNIVKDPALTFNLVPSDPS